MKTIVYNIKKHFSFTPGLIQTIIFLLCAGFMIISHLISMHDVPRTWLNYLEEGIFWFFFIISLFLFIAFIVRIFIFDFPSAKTFKITKIIFIVSEIIMILIALIGAIIFLTSLDKLNGHDEYSWFYRTFIGIVLLSMAATSIAVLIPVIIFKNPHSLRDSEKGVKHG